jgi:hypothetical protein
MKTYSAPEYLSKVLCADLVRMCESGFPFYAYGILCQGIELAGALFDTKNSFDVKGLSEDRFARGVKEIYAHQRYAKCKKDLYEQLRGSLIHQFRPGERFMLGSTMTGASESSHLSETDDGRIVLVIETLIEDFRKRLDVILAEGSKWQGMMDKTKLNGAFLMIDEPDETSEPTSGSAVTPSLSGRPYENHCFTYKAPSEY